MLFLSFSFERTHNEKNRSHEFIMKTTKKEKPFSTTRIHKNEYGTDGSKKDKRTEQMLSETVRTL
jgi:hypothetical protein